jgi:hypothetical protein
MRRKRRQKGEIWRFKMNENMNFTVEETNFIAVFAEDDGDKHEVIAAIWAAIPLIEPEMTDLAAACVKKLDRMAEDEFYEMDFDLVGVAWEME